MAGKPQRLMKEARERQSQADGSSLSDADKKEIEKLFKNAKSRVEERKKEYEHQAEAYVENIEKHAATVSMGKDGDEAEGGGQTPQETASKEEPKTTKGN